MQLGRLTEVGASSSSIQQQKQGFDVGRSLQDPPKPGLLGHLLWAWVCVQTKD